MCTGKVNMNQVNILTSAEILKYNYPRNLKDPIHLPVIRLKLMNTFISD